MTDVPFWEKPMVAVFCDGGVVLKNPSEIAGTWAWCGVSEDGTHVREQSGYLLPDGHPFPGWARVPNRVVTNNETEFYAALRALENVPDNWTGKLASDSQVTLKRLWMLMEWNGVGKPPVETLPASWQERAKARLAILPDVRFVQLAGHPTSYDLTRGYATKTDVKINPFNGTETRASHKVQVSRHQVWCDERCSYLSSRHAMALAIPSWYEQEHPDGPVAIKKVTFVDADEAAA